jgi:hypothetical protein
VVIDRWASDVAGVKLFTRLFNQREQITRLLEFTGEIIGELREDFVANRATLNCVMKQVQFILPA